MRRRGVAIKGITRAGEEVEEGRPAGAGAMMARWWIGQLLLFSKRVIFVIPHLYVDKHKQHILSAFQKVYIFMHGLSHLNYLPLRSLPRLVCVLSANREGVCVCVCVYIFFMHM